MSDFVARLKPKKSSVSGERPSASDLHVGEIAVNTADGKLFVKHNDNSIKEISGSGSSSGGGGGGTGLNSIAGAGDYISRQEPQPFNAWKRWSQGKSDLNEFDLAFSDFGAWTFIEPFPGVQDPQFFVSEVSSNFQVVSQFWGSLPATGTLAIRLIPIDVGFDGSNFVVEHFELEYTNLHERVNGSWSFQVSNQALFTQFVAQQGNGGADATSATGLDLFVQFTEPVVDLEPDDKWILQFDAEQHGWRPTPRNLLEAADGPGQDVVDDVNLYPDENDLKWLYYSASDSKFNFGFPIRAYETRYAYQSVASSILNAVGAPDGFPYNPDAFNDLTNNTHYDTTLPLYSLADENPADGSTDGNKFEETFLPIDVPSWLAGKSFFGQQIPPRIYAQVKYGGALFWDNNGRTPDISEEHLDFRETGKNLDMYIAFLAKHEWSALQGATVVFDGFDSEGNQLRQFKIRLDFVDEVDYRTSTSDQPWFKSQIVTFTFYEDGGFKTTFSSNFSALKQHGGAYQVYGNSESWDNGIYYTQGIVSRNTVRLHKWSNYRINRFQARFPAPTETSANYGLGLSGLRDVKEKSATHNQTLLWDSGQNLYTPKTIEPSIVFADAPTTDVYDQRRFVFTHRGINLVDELEGESYEYFPEKLEHLDVNGTVTQGATLIHDGTSWIATPFDSVDSVTSVAGFTGDVTLQTSDLTDVIAKPTKEARRYELTSSSVTAGKASFDSATGQLVIFEDDLDGSDTFAWFGYLQTRLPYQVTIFKGTERLATTQFVTSVGYNRGKLTLFTAGTTWAAGLSDGDIFTLEIIRGDLPTLTPAVGDLLLWNGQHFEPSPLDASSLNITGFIGEAPENGKQYARIDGNWEEVAAAYDDTALDGRVTTAEADIDALELTVAGLSSYDDTALDNRVTTAEGEIDALELTVAGLSNYDDSAIDNRVTTAEGDIDALESAVAGLANYDDSALAARVTTLEGEVAALQGEVTTLTAELATKIESAPVDGTAYVHQNGQWVSLATVLTAMGITGAQPPAIPEIVNGGDFASGAAGSVDVTVSGGDFTSGAAGSADETIDGGVFTSPVTPAIPETVNGGDFTSGAAGSVEVTVSGGDFTSGIAGSADETIDGGIFTSNVSIPETVNGGDFTSGESGSVDVTLSGGDFTSGAAGSSDETIDGGVFTSNVSIPETVSGGDFTSGAVGSVDVTLSGGDFTSGASGSQDLTLDGGVFTASVSNATLSGGDFTSGAAGSVDATYGGGDFTSGDSGSSDVTLDGGVFSFDASNATLSGGDFTSGSSGTSDASYGGGDFTSGVSGSSDVTLDGGVFTGGVYTAGGGDFTSGGSGGSDVTYGGGDFNSGSGGSSDVTLDGGEFTSDGETAGGGDFTSGLSGGSDVTYGGGDFTSGGSGSEDTTLDGGDFGGPEAAGGDFTSGSGGGDDTTYGAGDFTSGTGGSDDVTLDGGNFTSEGGGDFTSGEGGGADITYGAGDFSSGESSGAAVTMDGGDFTS